MVDNHYTAAYALAAINGGELINLCSVCQPRILQLSSHLGASSWRSAANSASSGVRGSSTTAFTFWPFTSRVAVIASAACSTTSGGAVSALAASPAATASEAPAPDAGISRHALFPICKQTLSYKKPHFPAHSVIGETTDHLQVQAYGYLRSCSTPTAIMQVRVTLCG